MDIQVADIDSTQYSRDSAITCQWDDPQYFLLSQADKVREGQLAAAALRGSEKAAHVRAVAAAARAREELEGSRRRAEWESKLQRAGEARYEMTQTMLSSLALV